MSLLLLSLITRSSESFRLSKHFFLIKSFLSNVYWHMKWPLKTLNSLNAHSHTHNKNSLIHGLNILIPMKLKILKLNKSGFIKCLWWQKRTSICTTQYKALFKVVMWNFYSSCLRTSDPYIQPNGVQCFVYKHAQFLSTRRLQSGKYKQQSSPTGGRFLLIWPFN
jgi:hypothetical protein